MTLLVQLVFRLYFQFLEVGRPSCPTCAPLSGDPRLQTLGFLSQLALFFFRSVFILAFLF